VANGECFPSSEVYRAAPFIIGNNVFTTDFFALPLASYDVILGTQWLASLGTILWDFGALTMSFWREGRTVRWHKVAGPDGPALKVCSDDGILAALLHELDALFVELSGMPPPRSKDHCINLLPRFAPVAVRPYHYPASHKDELNASAPPCWPGDHPTQHLSVFLASPVGQEGRRHMPFLPRPQRHHRQGRLPHPGGG
jgi:hypothetical protein